MQKKSKRFAAISAITALGLLISAGCSSQTATNNKGSGQSSSNKRLKLSMMYPLYSDPPQKAEVWKFVEDKFNIELDPMAVPSNSYTEKQKVITASGDMPDAMVWTTYPDPEFVKMVKQGAFLALDDLIKTAPNIQKTPQGIWDNIKIDGKIYGIPRPRALTRAAVMIRKDWLDNLGLPIPKTTDEIYQTAVKFTTMDPDKNGKNDTFGIALGENLSRLEAFWMAFDTGNGWRIMEDGTLMEDSTTPGRKEALRWLRSLYQEGGLDKDFAVLKTTQVWDKLQGGKAGIYIGGQTSDFSKYVESLAKIDPKAQLIMINPPAGPTGKSGFPETSGFFGEIVIPAKLDKNKVNRVIEFLDWQASEEGNNMSRYGIEGVHFTKKPDGTMDLNAAKLKADGSSPFLNNPYDPYSYVTASAPPAVQKLQKENLDRVKDMGIKNPALAYISPTQVEKGTDLDKFRDETFVKIVMGKAPIEDFDKFVQEWLDKGGRQITKEVNDWYKANKK